MGKHVGGDAEKCTMKFEVNLSSLPWVGAEFICAVSYSDLYEKQALLDNICQKNTDSNSTQKKIIETVGACQAKENGGINRFGMLCLRREKSCQIPVIFKRQNQWGQLFCKTQQI